MSVAHLERVIEAPGHGTPTTGIILSSPVPRCAIHGLPASGGEPPGADARPASGSAQGKLALEDRERRAAGGLDRLAEPRLAARRPDAAGSRRTRRRTRQARRRRRRARASREPAPPSDRAGGGRGRGGGGGMRRDWAGMRRSRVPRGADDMTRVRRLGRQRAHGRSRPRLDPAVRHTSV